MTTPARPSPRLTLALLGRGHVGGAVGAAAARAGHTVVAARTPSRPDGPDPVEAVTGADLALLAVPFDAVEPVLAPVRAALSDTVLVDATNPVGPGLTHALRSQRSGAEHIAALVPEARVVKALNVYGFENLTDPPTGPDGLRPLMPYAGDDPDAKGLVAGLLADLGWDPLDAGPLRAALDLEHLALLWVRLVRMGGHDPRLVWAALRG